MSETSQESAAELSSAASNGVERKLSGTLGAFVIMLIILAGAAPLTTVSATVPVALIIGNGAAFPSMYVIAAVILAFFAVGFTAMTPYVRNAGAFYSYVTEGLGRSTGLVAAYLALLTYTAVQVGVYAFLGVVLSDFIVSIGGPLVAWWIFSGFSLVVVGLLGYRNISLSAKTLGVILVSEILICGAVIIAVLLKGGGPDGLSVAAVNPTQIFSGSPVIALMFAISGFLGFEAAAIFRDEARTPAKTIPRAMYGGLALIGGFYALTSWAMISGWGDQQAVARAETNSATMLLDTAQMFIGTVGFQIMQYLLIGSVFACVLCFHNVIARYIFSLANSGALPEKWGESHPIHKSPHIASMVQTASAFCILAICVIAGLEPITEVFTWFVGVATVGVLLLMLLACIAVVVHFRTNKADTRVWNTKIAPWIGCILLAAVTAVTVWNLPLLVGGNTMAAVVIAVFIITVGIALVVARSKPLANRRD